MTTISDVSSVLGEYMLKQWVLTEKPCHRCKTVPLLRSPKGQTPIIHFCANCDGDPQKVSQISDSTSISSASSASSQNHTISRASTPPTEISSRSSSPTFLIPAETPESRRRREQSDRASSEIGRRLLKGWALLGDECLNEECFGVPLVRPPKSGGEKDPRKECVICGRIYVNEDELAEGELPVSSAEVAATLNPPAIPRESVKALPRVEHPAELVAVAPTGNSTMSALNATTHALEKTLLNLSERLISPSLVMNDPHSISAIVDTISKTTQALSEVKKLEKQLASHHQ
ncbi:hypothetical protein BT96DRAFT_847225 [Gymnopus androsaceus JB14]|uniref:Sjogrens syndrome scleroderma autoantigen 1 family protein n=1 Tax=Gymnopus androsaceus JB14 TaxID=1447944 RepID=A0A6A4IMZ3_9AGAR|nr:hypothetical protein BT96DRAFT_847225 [Gymnopus androsaceus JB14]